MNQFGMFLDLSVKMSLVWVLTFLLVWLLRHAAASLRQLSWHLAFSGALFLPTLAWFLPSWKSPLLPSSWLDFGTPVAEPLLAFSCASLTGSTASTWLDRLGEVLVRSLGADSLLGLAFALWLTVAAAYLIAVFLGHVALTRTFNQAEQRPELNQLVRRCARQIGLKHNPLVAVGDFAMPATFGLWQPRIFLPEAASTWSSQRLSAVLLHEMAHIKAGDYFFNLLAEFVCALFWFNPLVWLAARQMRIEREKAADDRVLATGHSEVAYAQHLYEIARSCRGMGFGSASAVAMAQSSTLQQRVQSILNPHQSRTRVSRSRLTLCFALFLLVLCPIAAMQPRFGGQPPQTTTPCAAPPQPGQPEAACDKSPVANPAEIPCEGGPLIL